MAHENLSDHVSSEGIARTGRAKALGWTRRIKRAARRRWLTSPAAGGAHDLHSDFSTTVTASEQAILDEARPYTLTSPERLLANMDAVTYVVARGVPGCLVECGVWRGGSVLAMIRTLQGLGVSDRDIFLFDTFEGMTEPTADDTSRFDEAALKTWTQSLASGTKPWSWAFDAQYFNLNQVKDVISGTGYPPERIHFVEGRVETTLPSGAPDEISILRLDTDWYESTWHELFHLYPRISDGGVLIIDDYGHWDGARKAVDRYFAEEASQVMLCRIDYTGRIAVKH